MWRILYILLLVPQNIVMDLNNVMKEENSLSVNHKI